MNRRVSIGAVALAMVLYMGGVPSVVAAQKPDRSIPASVGDLTAATLIEIRDESGKVLLNGTFATSKDTPKEVEREAELKSPSGAEAKGKAEIEVERKDGLAKEDEIELTVEKLPAMATLSVVVDGQRVGTFTTSKKGKAEVKLERKFGL